MNVTPNTIYHIYNQGNNRRPIFLKGKNYGYFLMKMKKHVAPHVSFLAYCLMPNHFHWLVYTRTSAAERANHRGKLELQNLNYQIAIMLRSYTRGINKQANMSGSLFRGTKYKTATNSNQQDWMGHSNAEMRYAAVCKQYIEQNPMKAGLVAHESQWSYSSVGSAEQKFQLCDRKMLEEFGL